MVTLIPVRSILDTYSLCFFLGLIIFSRDNSGVWHYHLNQSPVPYNQQLSLLVQWYVHLYVGKQALASSNMI